MDCKNKIFQAYILSHVYISLYFNIQLLSKEFLVKFHFHHLKAYIFTSLHMLISVFNDCIFLTVEETEV